MLFWLYIASFAVVAAVLPPTMPAHPRIVLTPDRIAALKALVESGDPSLLAGYAALQNYTDFLMTIPPLHCQPFEPSRSQEAYPMLTRLLSLGLVYKLTGDVAVGRRGVAELLNLTTDPAWGAGTDPHEDGWIMHAFAPLSSAALLYVRPHVHTPT